jgi:hypothetical protein
MIMCQKVPVLNTLWSSYQRVLDNLQRHYQEGCLLTNKEATVPFFNRDVVVLITIRGSPPMFCLTILLVAHLNLVRQSL